MTNVQGGAALPVSVSTQAPIGDKVIPVAVVADGRPTLGGDAMPVYVVSAAELAAGGFTLDGGDPRPVVAAAAGVPVTGQRPIPVYVVSGSLGGPAIVTSNLLAEYRFLAGGADTGPNGFTATLGGGASQQAFGIQLAADADFVSFPVGAQIASQLNHTWQIVARVPVAASDLIYVEGDGASTEFIYLNRGVASGNLSARYRRTTATSYDVTASTGAAAMPLNTWTMITLRRAGTALTLYVNDRAITATATPGAAALPSRTVNRLNNGGGTPALSNPARPDVAYLVSYSAALSDGEVSANYAAIKSYLAGRGVALP